jgi:hypothetical protein
MRRRGARVAIAMAVLACGQASHAQSDFKTANELAKKCISDDRSACSSYIIGSVDSLEDARQVRGEPSCLADHPSKEEIVKTFVRAILAKYAYSDLSAAAAVENIYAENCPRQN